MQTVEDIIASVYGNATGAAGRLGVLPSAVSNWKAFGQFPARLVAPILTHAREKGVEIDVSEIPISPTTKAEAPA